MKEFNSNEARIFLNDRINSLIEDVRHCVLKDDGIAPFPGLLYCFSTIDLLGALYKGSTSKYSVSYNARKYMEDRMSYKKENVAFLVQNIFRHPLVHQAMMQPTVYCGHQKYTWAYIHNDRSKHLIIEEFDGIKKLWVSIFTLAQDIEDSVINDNTGYVKMLENNSDLQDNFIHVYNSIMEPKPERIKTIKIDLLVRLYTWTIRDIENIYSKTFSYNYSTSNFEGPSNSYAVLLAALFDVWGSIFNDKFGIDGNTNLNVKRTLKELYDKDVIDCKRNKKNQNYNEIVDDEGNIRDDIVKIFRHNLVHNFGKKSDGPYDLSIDSEGKAISYIYEADRWHINCKKLADDFLNLLRVKLPELIKNNL